jgi:serine/threonine-protein kinase
MLARKLGHVLSGLHAEGVVHRGVHPDNVVIGRGPDEDANNHDLAPSDAEYDERLDVVELAPLARPTSEVGSPSAMGYLSPEAVLGFTPDTKVDCWAFAVLLFRCIYGRMPFRAATTEELLSALERPVVVPAAFSVEADLLLCSFFERCFAHRSSARLTSARTIAETFAALLDEVRLISSDELPLTFHVRQGGPSPFVVVAVKSAASR